MTIESGDDHEIKLLHLKNLQVTLSEKGEHRLSVQLKVGDNSVELSSVKSKDRICGWDTVLIFPSSAELNVTVTRHKYKTIKTELCTTQIPLSNSEENKIVKETGGVQVQITLSDLAEEDAFLSGKLALERRKPWMKNLENICDNLSVLEPFKDALSEIHPAVGASISAATFVMTILLNEKTCHDEISSLIVALQNMTAFITQLKDNKDKLFLEETKALIKKSSEFTSKTCKFIQDIATKGHLAMMLDQSIKNEMEEFHAEIDIFERQYKKCIAAEIFQATLSIKEQAVLNDRLRPFSCDTWYNSEKCCIDGTRTALLGEINTWGSPDTGDQSSRVFWLHGIAGSGKTTIAHSTAVKFKQLGLLGAVFFGRRDHSEFNDPQKVLPTLAHQLAQVDFGYKDHVIKQLEVHRLSAEMSVSDQYDILFHKYVTETSKKDTKTRRIFVVDALDESGEPATRQSLVKSIVRLSSSVRPFYVFVTSRNEDDIHSQLVTETTKEVNIFDYNADTDIRKYIYTFIANPTLKVKLRISEQQIDSLTKLSSGLFIWISTVLRFLGDSFNYKRDLKQILAGSNHAGAVSSLDQMYRTILNIVSGENNVDNKIVVKEMLAVILSASKRKAMPTCMLAVIFSEVDEEGEIQMDIIRRLHSVVYVDAEEDDTLRIYHASFADFLQTKARCGDFFEEEAIINSKIVAQCLSYMSQNLKFNICGLESSFVLNKDVTDLQERIETNISQSLKYTCYFWTSYLDCLFGVVLLDIYQFLNTPSLMYWIEIFTLLDELDTMMDRLRVLYSKLPISEREAKQGVYDTIYFVQSNYSVLQNSTPFLYLSALPWAVESSHMSTFKSVFPNTFKPHSELLAQLTPTGTTVIPAHFSVKCVAFSPDCQVIASGALDGTVRFWDARFGAPVGAPFQGHSSAVSAVVFSPDGTQLVSGSYDNTVIVWDMKSGEPMGEPMQGHTNGVTSVTFSPEAQYIASGSFDGTLIIWNATTRTAVGQPFKGHTDQVASIAFFPDGQHIVSGSGDKTIGIWNARLGTLVGDPLTGHEDSVTSVAVSPNGKFIASGANDATVRLWDVASRTQVGAPMKGHIDSIVSVSFSPDNRMIVSGSADTTIRLWDVESRTPVSQRVTGHSSWITSVEFSADGQSIVSGSNDDTIRIWNVKSLVGVAVSTREHSRIVTSIAITPDGNYIVSGSYDQTVMIWNAKTGVPRGEPLRGHSDTVTTVVVSKDGKYIASASYDKTIRIWDLETGTLTGEALLGHTGPVHAIAFSPDSQFIVSGGGDKTTRLWSMQTRTQLGETLTEHTSLVVTISFSPDGRTFATGSFDETMIIWDVETRTPIGDPMRGHRRDVNCLAYSPDGELIVTGSFDETVRLWDVKSRTQIGGPLEGHDGPVLSVAFSNDGRWIASTGFDRTIRIWDVRLRALVCEPLYGHSNNVGSVIFSPDDQFVISGASDKTVKIWSLAKYHSSDDAPTNFTDDLTQVLLNSGSSAEEATFVAEGLSNKLQLSRSSLSCTKFVRTGYGGWVDVNGSFIVWIPDKILHLLKDTPVLQLGHSQLKSPAGEVGIDFSFFCCGRNWEKVKSH